jgi:exopolysaccharide production protein ExoQ
VLADASLSACRLKLTISDQDTKVVSPDVASILCSALVVCLLIIDHKQSLNVSTALWIPTLWMLHCASRPLACWFGSGSFEGDIEAGSSVDQAFLGLLIVMAFLIVTRRGLKWCEIISNNKWLFLLFLYMGLSAVWSDLELISFKRWIKASGALLMGGVIISELDAPEAMRSVLRRSAYVLVPFSVLLVKYYHDKGIAYNEWTGEAMWTGVTPQKNCLGRLCLIAGFFLFWELWGRWRECRLRQLKYQTISDCVVLGMSIYLLRGSDSATALAVLGLGIAVFAGLLCFRERFRKAGPAIEVTSLAILLALCVAYFLLGDTLLASVVGSFGRDMTFTGRTTIWGILWPEALKSPVVGLGYGSFWVHPPESLNGLNEGHNGYLDVFLELGIVGLLALGRFLWQFYWRARVALHDHFQWAAFNICFLVMAMVHNFTESSFARSTTHLWTVMIFLSMFSSKALRDFRVEIPTSSLFAPGRKMDGTTLDGNFTPPVHEERVVIP